jgi:hypothetical protein
MSDQVLNQRGLRLKRAGIALLGAGLIVIASACTSDTPSAPVVVPAQPAIQARVPTAIAALAATTPTSNTVIERAHPLEMFRYAGQPIPTEPRSATVRSLEFYRYSGQSTLAQSQAPAQSREFYRYAGPSATAAPPSERARPLEIFRYTGRPARGS